MSLTVSEKIKLAFENDCPHSNEEFELKQKIDLVTKRTRTTLCLGCEKCVQYPDCRWLVTEMVAVITTTKLTDIKVV